MPTGILIRYKWLRMPRFAASACSALSKTLVVDPSKSKSACTSNHAHEDVEGRQDLREGGSDQRVDLRFLRSVSEPLLFGTGPPPDKTTLTSELPEGWNRSTQIVMERAHGLRNPKLGR